MSNHEKKTTTTIANNSNGAAGNILDIAFYGEDVFNAEAMQKYLPNAVAKKLLSTINDGVPLDEAIAAEVAHAMKEWALARGATHFTHWFLPLTGSTAEKHDAFLEINNGQAVMTFSGKNLISSEPDASSFPSGGLRSTFEARGYTAWDPTSPAFIKRHANGATLCIPTAFCSYTGDALDKKTPLLRSLQALTVAVKRLMKCFQQPEEKVRVSVGIEQEYFLIDKKYYVRRPDLVQTGRTIFGATPPKHQQLEDHYFGSIKMRVLNFMTEVERELWRLGIPAKTRHNECAPAQFELAPIFEDVNLAIDHNMLIMQVLREVAERYDLVCLLHEKPFAGVNGSGKHNNWSITYGDTNLLNPGRDPRQNAIFLTVLCAMIKALDEHYEILRASVASAGNEHRLGANEAPPAIMSMYLGEQLTDIITQIENGETTKKQSTTTLRIGVDTLPPLPLDSSDRNRTSPFAFTGNKFEFRAPGASQSCAGPCIVINTMIANAFTEFAEKLEKTTPANFNRELQKLLQQTIRQHQRIIFNGDNYSAAWRQEAKKRGLTNVISTPTSLRCLVDKKSIALFTKFGVYTPRELESRCEVFLEEYHRRIHIEGRLALEMAHSIFIPTIAAQYKEMVETFAHAEMMKIKLGTKCLRSTIKILGDGLDVLAENCEELRYALSDQHEKIIIAMQKMRTTVDNLENFVADKYWQLPKYREMLFIY